MATLVQETLCLIWCWVSWSWSTAMNFYGRCAARGSGFGGSTTLYHCHYRSAGSETSSTLWCTASLFSSSFTVCVAFHCCAAAKQKVDNSLYCIRQVLCLNPAWMMEYHLRNRFLLLNQILLVSCLVTVQNVGSLSFMSELSNSWDTASSHKPRLK